MEKLIDELKDKVALMNEKTGNKYKLGESDLDNLYSVYPFNKFEYVISHLIGENILTIDQYLEMRRNYLDRNQYLYTYEITAPRTFGETWAQHYLNEVVPQLEAPSTKLDKCYSGQYDFWYQGIRIEVKASRAVKRKSGGALIMKAISSDSKMGFDMNFQQLKPACCDVFVWIGVWRDTIRYWVLSSNEVMNNPYYSGGQHRGNHGEGQLWLKETNIDEFNQYEVGAREILDKIIEKAKQ